MPWRDRALRLIEFVVLAALLAATQVLSALWLLPNGDVDEYHQYALAFWTHLPLLHTLPAEYPPLAIAPFTLALLPPTGDYHRVFAVWMAALTLLGYAAFVRFAGRRRALIYMLYLLLGATATLLARFDIVPALVTLAALWAAERRRFALAYALVAAGTLLKLYPAFLLPVVAIEHWHTLSPGGAPRLTFSAFSRRSLRSLAARPEARAVTGGVAFCVALIAAGFAGALALNTQGTLSVFTYAGLRPLQVESTPASIMWLGSLVGVPALPDYSFVSLNLAGPLEGILRPLSAVALLVGVAAVYWRQARGKLSVGYAFVGCLSVVLVTNKIFSPQYLIWVLPVVAYVEGFDPLWVAICVLTWLDFPMIYQTRHPIITVPYNPLFLPVVALRNALLLWVTVRVIMRRGPMAGGQRRATRAQVAEAEPASGTGGAARSAGSLSTAEPHGG
ncbi:MAG: glycosyltransferase 87 family protein [Ktedonobacterales bacterium]